MGFRFRKSVRIAPGVRLSSSGTLSVGARGASVSFGRRGTYANVGIPGTGIGYRGKLSGGSQRGPSRAQIERAERKRFEEEDRERRLSSVSAKLNDDGTLSIEDADGDPLKGKELKLFWEQGAERVEAYLNEHVAEINGERLQLADIHLLTPSPNDHPTVQTVPFDEKRPVEPAAPKDEAPPREPAPPKSPGLFGRMIPGAMKRYERRVAEMARENRQRMEDWHSQRNALQTQYEAARAQFKRDLSGWSERKRIHDAEQAEIALVFDTELRAKIETMEEILGGRLDSIEWPRETLIDFEIVDDGKAVGIDVDLPEIEDMPLREANLAPNGKRLHIKDLSQTRLQQAYARHVHGLIMRVSGEALAALPSCERVVISGYTQRIDKATGVENDDYVLSAVIDRERFSRIDFEALERVDPCDAIGAFEPRRQMLKSGLMKAIKPLEISDL